MRKRSRATWIAGGFSVVIPLVCSVGLASVGPSRTVAPSNEVFAARIIDDGDGGFNPSENQIARTTPRILWRRFFDAGYEGDYIAGRAGGKRDAKWAFRNVSEGLYDVYVTWVEGADRTPAATYRVEYDRQIWRWGKRVETVVDQQKAPTGLEAAGVQWHKLATIDVTSGDVRMKLSAPARIHNGTIIQEVFVADAVWLRPNLPDPVCGDGAIWAPFEQCDDGNLAAGDGCSRACRIEACANGVLELDAGEYCDDGNTQGGDGCTSICEVEPLFTCWGSPSKCRRACKDGICPSGFYCTEDKICEPLHQRPLVERK